MCKAVQSWALKIALVTIFPCTVAQDVFLVESEVVVSSQYRSGFRTGLRNFDTGLSAGIVL